MTRPAERPYFLEGIEYLEILDGDGHYLQLPKLTTAQRDALSATEGMMIYNSDTGVIEAYQNGSWGTVPRLSGDLDAANHSISNVLAINFNTVIASDKTVTVPSGQMIQILLPVEYYPDGIKVDGTLKVDGGFLLVGI